MFVTFGATFFGVIASFLLWFGGQWWLKRRHDQKAVKHMVREIHEELALNINILVGFTESTPKMIAGGNIPFFLPHRMNLSAYHYLTSSGELRLLDVSKQRWILYAGTHCEHFNKFIDNTELLLTWMLGLPNGLKYARQRLEMLVEQAKETAKNLNKILETLDVSKVKDEEEKGPRANTQDQLSVPRREFLTTGVIFFLFSLTLYIYRGSPFVFTAWKVTWHAPELVSAIVNGLEIFVLIIGSVISVFCLVGSFLPRYANRMVIILARRRRLKRWLQDGFGAFFPLAFLLNFFTSWIQKLVGVAKNEVIFFLIFAIGLIWTAAIVVSQKRGYR